MKTIYDTLATIVAAAREALDLLFEKYHSGVLSNSDAETIIDLYESLRDSGIDVSEFKDDYDGIMVVLYGEDEDITESPLV